MHSVIILKKRWERKYGVTTACLFEADDIDKSTKGVVFWLPAVAHKIIVLEKIFLSCFAMIRQFEIFFNELYFFLVAHAYRKLTDTLEWLPLKKTWYTSHALGWCVYKQWSPHWDTLHYIDLFTKDKHSTKQYGQKHDFHGFSIVANNISLNNTAAGGTYDIYTFNEAVFDRQILF